MAKLEISKDEMNNQMMKKHHSEMITAIKSIRLESDDKESDAIKYLERSVNELSKKISLMQQPKINIPKAEFDTKEMVNLLSNISKSISELKDNIGKKEKIEKREYDFLIERNFAGYIQSVKVKEK